MWGPLVMVGDLGPGGRGRGNRAGDGGSVPGVPVFVTAQPVANWLKPVEGQPAVYHTEGVGVDQDKPKDVNLIPFYKASGRTYAVYWDVFTKDEWSKKEAEYADREGKEAPDRSSDDRLRSARPDATGNRFQFPLQRRGHGFG